jgi:hypothetical protein
LSYYDKSRYHLEFLYGMSLPSRKTALNCLIFLWDWSFGPPLM